MKTSLQDIAGRLMHCPAAPYHESIVAAEVLAICREHRLLAEVDPFGNILVSLRRGRATPLVLAAHLDHPGFVFYGRKNARRRPEAEFRGGVADEYFQPGTPLLLYPGGIQARLGRRLSKEKRFFEINTTRRMEEHPAFAVWDLPVFRATKGRITGRACDDLVGAATILHVLIELSQSDIPLNLTGVFSRAEEVGFHGALALAESKRLPKNALIISLETSREMSPVKMGHGVIIRVGDRASTFDSAFTRFLAEIATDLQKNNCGFRFQRALMSGGTCEATAYQEYGYRCAAVCVALGNYHNCAPGHKIRAEFVSVSDANHMSELLQQCASQLKNFDAIAGRLPKRLQAYAREATTRLTRHHLAWEGAREG